MIFFKDDGIEESELPPLNKKKMSDNTSQQPIQEDEITPLSPHPKTKHVTLPFYS